jgi:hypothetical protein
VCVRAVSRREDVAVRHCARDADGDRLLADRNMEKPRQLACSELLLHLLLESPDEEHLAIELPQARLRERTPPCCLGPGHEPEFMLRAMGLVAQWTRIAATLPAGWNEAQLRLSLTRPGEANRASALLGPIGPGRVGDELRIRVTPGGSSGPDLVHRLLVRLDDEGIGGTLELMSAGEAAAEPETRADSRPAASLAAAWNELIESLPEDWSDLLCVLELRSTDELDPAALAIAPLNPSRHGDSPSFRFRVARRFGYGAAPEMARRCLARLYEAGIPGSLRLLEALSDTRPVATQGPTFIVAGRAV